MIDKKQAYYEATKQHVKHNSLEGQLPYYWNLARNFQHLIGSPSNPGLLSTRDFNIDAAWRLDRDEEGNYNNRPEMGPAIVIGSGASLDKAMPDLNAARKAHNAKIYCCPSQVWALLAHDIMPDYVVVHDPFGINAQYISVQAWEQGMGRIDIRKIAGIQMITHPGASWECMSWPTFEHDGSMFITKFVSNNEFYSEPQKVSVTGYEGIEQMALSCYTQINSTPWFDNTKYGLLHYVVIGPNTTLMAAMLAAYMGHPQVYYVGYDLCHWQDKLRFHTQLPDGTESEIPQIPRDASTFDCDFAPFTTQTDMIQGKICTLEAQAFWMGSDFSTNMVEVVVDGTPGNLELLPRIGMEEFVKGGTRNVPMIETRAKIIDNGVRGGWLGWQKIGFENLPEQTKQWLAQQAIDRRGVTARGGQANAE